VFDQLYASYGKRAFDLALAILGLVVFGPLLLLLALGVRFSSPGPVLFVQERLGLGGTTFRVFKFRTMIARQRSEHSEVWRDNPEVTRLGHVLRRFKLDELPQLLNVVRGDMSLVGPRPGLPTQLSEYDEEGRLRLLVRPGLTGLAQVSGNIFLSWPERWALDAKYVRRPSLSLDLWILWRTLAVLVRGEQHYLHRPVDTKNSKGT